jgi:hypothetical protein
MASKKYLLMAGIITLLSAFESKAQENLGMYKGAGYDITDSTLIPVKRMPQQTDFTNGQYDFPAMPRNQWEIGISGGMLNVSGDVRSKTIFNRAKKPMNTLGWGLSVRKAWGYVISTRLQFLHGSASGYNWQASQAYWGHSGNPIFEGYGSSSTLIPSVYNNYTTTINQLSVDVMASLNNIKYHRATNKTSYYALLGAGLMTYNTRIDMKKASGAMYTVADYATATAGITNPSYSDRKEINKNLNSLFDGDYETQAESHKNRANMLNGTVRPVVSTGFGVQFKLSKMVSLQIEDKMTLTMDDLIDGQRWQELPTSTTGLVSSSMSRDYDNLNFFSVGLNVNLGAHAIAPLWWHNPNDYSYNALKNSKAPLDSKCDKDADGDGISDCFDRCPNTPGGVSVDSHGCPFDTDGDGVADYKDKQLITPTDCQPVDADGVGKCPEPACCSGIVTNTGCSAIAAGSVEFSSGSAKLSSTSMAQLNTLAGSMRSNPNCKTVVIGNGSGSKIEQQRSWDRVNSVINYMVDKQGIDRERFIFQYGNNGNANSVDYRSAGNGEEGPSNTPPPFPNLRKN